MIRRRKEKQKKAPWVSVFGKPKVEKKPKRIRSATNQMSARRAKYRKEVREWLKLPENRECKVWRLSEEFFERCFETNTISENARATQCHHKYGRILTKKGDLLLEKKWWIPVSAAGHFWIDAHRDEARKLGLLAPEGQYNTWPE